MGPLIEARGLTQFFGGTAAIHGLDLSIMPGGPTGLVGPNGAGKTTLFSLLSGCLRPSAGVLRLMGQTPGDAALCGRFAILPQDAPFQRGMPIKSQLTCFARLQGMTTGEARFEAERVLQWLGIAELGHRSAEQLSHGQFKRAAIAQTLIGDPELVLLDEPTAGLDPVAATAVRRMILRQGAERTFIISSHNLDEIRDLCKEVVLLDKGKLVRHSRMEELIETGQYLTITLSQPPDPSVATLLLGLEGVRQVETGQGGDNRLLIRFDAADVEQFQIRLLQLLSGRGIGIIQFSRGKNLADSVLDMVERS